MVPTGGWSSAEPSGGRLEPGGAQSPVTKFDPVSLIHTPPGLFVKPLKYVAALMILDSALS